MDKRSTQLSLPLSTEGKEIKEIVKQHWNITFSRQGKISVVGKRIMALVLAQIQDNDMSIKKYYQMRISDVMDASDAKGKSTYDTVKKALDELARQVWSIEDLEKEIYRPKQLINTSTIEAKDGFEYGYVKGLITIVINPALEPYFIGMAHYTKYEIGNYMKFKSWYSMRIWEILSAYKDTGVWAVDLEDFRNLMDCKDKYPKTPDLIKYTLTEPLEELTGTALEFTFEKVLAKYHGKGRAPVVGLQFTLVKRALTKVPESWFRTSERHARILTHLIEKWEIEEANICKYGEALTLNGMAKIIKQFQEKQLSNDRINDKKKYCNKVFCDAGKSSNGGH
jgi:plasmid replication initiation protein